MNINVDELFNKDAFQTIDPERVAIFKEFAREIDGKSTMEIMGIYMKFSKRLPADKPITDDEKAAIVQAIGESVPPEDQGKFQSMLKMLSKFA